MTELRHIHFGAGRLGLGFVCWLAHKAGLKTTALNRKGSVDRMQRGNLLTTADRNNFLLRNKMVVIQNLGSKIPAITRYQLHQFLEYDESNPESAANEIRQSETRSLLVTFSFGSENAYAAAFKILSKYIRIHQSKNLKKVYFVCCENTISTRSVFSRFQHAHPEVCEGIEFVPLESMVDRICSSMSSRRASNGDMVVVHTERFAQLVLERESKNGSLTRALEPIDENVKFTDWIDLEKKRKVWILNGAHSLLAFNGLYFGYEHLNDYLDRSQLSTMPDVELKQVLAAEGIDELPSIKQRQYESIALIKELALGFDAYLDKSEDGKKYRSTEFGESEIESYCKQIFSRFADSEDHIGRILSTFNRTKFDSADSSITTFMKKKFTPKISENFRSYLEAYECGPRYVSQTLMRIFQLIAHERFIDES